MPINTDNWNDLVKNAMVVFREGYEGVPENARQLYDIVGNPYKTSEYSQIDSPGYAKRKDEGGAYKVGSPQQGYTLDIWSAWLQSCVENFLNCGKLLTAY